MQSVRLGKAQQLVGPRRSLSNVDRRLLASTALLVAAAGSLMACDGSSTTVGPPADRPAAPEAPPASATPPSSPPAGPSSDQLVASRLGPGPGPSNGRPLRALLSIPALGLHHIAVVPYWGHTDDAPGTRIQDRGRTASPFGPRGGVGPGGVGNYLVTGHRTSSTHPFAMLPTLQPGARVVVVAGGVRYVYEVRRTRETSFRSTRSLAEQRAALPGHPGATPTRAFVTLSTCATQEDHAEGNYWSDELHNPEHRVDKIGVLVRTVVAD